MNEKKERKIDMLYVQNKCHLDCCGKQKSIGWGMACNSPANDKHGVSSNRFGRNYAIFSLVLYKRKCGSVSVSD